MNMSNMEISQIQKKTYRSIPFFLLFFIPFFIIVNSLMVSNIVPDALVSITGKGSERFLGQLPQEKNIQWNWVKGHADNKYNNMADELARSKI